MTRKMKTFFTLAAVFPQLALCSMAAAKPNILFLAVDDMRPLLGCYGDTQVVSPNIDKLAANGTVFSNAHCQWAVCGPSRVSIMTSLMPETTGVMGFRQMRSKIPDLVTLPQYLIANGYETTGIGKIYDYRTVDDKFDERSWSIPYHSHAGTKKMLHAKGNPPAGIFDGPVEEHADYQVAQGGIALIKRLAQSDKPFFLGVGFYKPHLPLVAPRKYWDLYERETFQIQPFQKHAANADPRTYTTSSEMRTYIDIPEGGLAEEDQKHIIHGYYACVSFIDDLVGQVLAELQANNLEKNTIVILWGDHGFHLGDHGQWAKHTNIEQTSRVPLIIYDPRQKNVIGKTGTPVQFLDVYPTLCDLAGITIPDQCQGKSLAPVITGAKKHVHHGVVTMKKGSCYAYRTDRYRYIEWVSKSGEVTSRNLYDYEKDPLETVNVAGNPEYKEVVKQLARTLREETQGCPKLLMGP
jgi:arylsulfatase A-like enzyme